MLYRLLVSLLRCLISFVDGLHCFKTEFFKVNISLSLFCNLLISNFPSSDADILFNSASVMIGLDNASAFYFYFQIDTQFHNLILQILIKNYCQFQN
jgi:hypothetical protein